MYTELQRLSLWPLAYQFRKEKKYWKQFQEKKLRDYLGKHPVIRNENDFQKMAPQTYETLCKLYKIEKYEGFFRFQPTSGSTSAEKLIPYTKQLKDEFHRALSPWLWDQSCRFPRVNKGKHYWSLSWVPDEWRERGLNTDDSELLPKWQRYIYQKSLAVPLEVSKTKNMESSLFATATYLCACENLSFISIWSPTYLIELWKYIEKNKREIEETLNNGKWAKFATELVHLHAPLRKNIADWNPVIIWPELALVSCWSSSTSKSWAKRLSELFAQAEMEGKGLWATEGVVTIPYQNEKVLAYQSHYYEWIKISNGEILKSWELDIGDEVSPLLTTGNGFLRYNLDDVLEVRTSRCGLPAFEFVGRNKTSDLCGEKLSHVIFSQLREDLALKFPNCRIDCFYSEIFDGKPRYGIMLDENYNDEILKMMKIILEKNFHYNLAKKLGQLGDETYLTIKNFWHSYEKLLAHRKILFGNMKAVDFIDLTNNEERKIFA